MLRLFYQSTVGIFFLFTNSWMLAYFAQKLYICGKKLKKSRILWWTRISWCILDMRWLCVVSIKLLLRWYWDQPRPPDLPVIPGCCCDQNPGTDIVEKYPDMRRIHRYHTQIYHHMRMWVSYTRFIYWRPRITAGQANVIPSLSGDYNPMQYQEKGFFAELSCILLFSFSDWNGSYWALCRCPHILPSIVCSIIEHSVNIPNIRCSET